MAWYNDIEDEVIAREQWHDHSVVINSFDSMVHQLELEALAFTERQGFQPSIIRKEVIDIYFTESGEKRYTKTPVIRQNVKWIINYIRHRLAVRAMFMSGREVSQTLHDVSQAYMASEMRRIPLTIQVSESLRHRIRRTG